MGAPVKEVYVGSTKVWPMVTGYYGSRWLRGDSGAVYERSNPDIVGSTPSGSGYGTYIWGVTLPANAGGQVTVSFDFSTTWATRGMFSQPGGDLTKGAYTLYDDQQQTARNTTTMVRAFCDAKDNYPAGRDAYVVVNASGTVLWSSEPGFSCVRSSTGVFVVTCPGPLQNVLAYATPRRSSAATNVMATPHNVNVAAGTLTVNSKAGGISSNNDGFCLWVVLA